MANYLRLAIIDDNGKEVEPVSLSDIGRQQVEHLAQQLVEEVLGDESDRETDEYSDDPSEINRALDHRARL